MLFALLLSACVPTEEGEKAYSGDIWLFDTCDNFPNLYSHGTTLGGNKVCKSGSAPTDRIVGYSIDSDGNTHHGH